MPMLVTCVCSTCSKVNMTVVNSCMIAAKQFSPPGWNILYNGDNKKSQVIPICTRDCMQIHVNRVKRSNVWIDPDGSEHPIEPVELH